MSAQHPYIPSGINQQGRFEGQPAPAECGTDVGANQPRTGRHRPLNAAYRCVLYRRPTYSCSAIAALSVVCALIWLVR